MLNIDTKFEGAQRSPKIVLVHAIALLDPFVHLILVHLGRVLFQIIRARTIVPEEDSAVNASKPGNAIFRPRFPAL